MDALRLLPARRGMHFDVAFERSFRILETQVALASTEQRHENVLEVLPHLHERRQEQLACRRVDLLYGLLKGELRRREISPLAGEHLEPPLLLFVLLDCKRVDGSESLDLLSQLGRLRAQRVVIEIERLHGLHELLERLTPLRLESLANHRASAGQLGEPELGGMKLFAYRGCAMTDSCQLVLRCFQFLIGRLYRELGTCEASLRILERGLLRLQIQVPRCELLRELPIGCRERAELGLQ